MRQADPSPSPEELHRRIAALEAENEVLRQAGAALAGGLNLERLVQTVTDAGVQLVGAAFGAFFYNVTDSNGQQYMLYTLSGAPREAFARFPMPGKTPLFAPTFDGEAIIRSDDITQDPRYGRDGRFRGMPPGHLPVRSYLAVPVISRTGTVLGGLFFGHPDPGVFTERAERAIRSITAQAAIAIDNAQLMQAVQNSERRFRALIERSADGIAVIDADSNVQYVSPAVTAIEGYTPEECIGGKGKDHTHPDDLSFMQEAVRKSLENPGKPIPVLCRRQHRDGRWLWLEGTATNLLHDPAVRGIVTNYRDVTVRKRAEETQIRSQKMEALGTLAGGIAHDFNNILLAITGNVKLAREDLPADHDIQQNLAEIAKASHRATELVRRILEFSRQQESQRAVIQLQPAVQEALKLLRSTLPAMIEINATVAEDVPPVLADPTQIHQIMLNLVTNAAHATGNDGGTVEVTLDSIVVGDELATALREGHYARITVSDDGCGMDKNTLERIFDPFFTTKPVGQGTGLGLSVVDGIVKNHEGSITVYSQLNKGTTFRVYLPAATGKASADDARPAETARGSGERVLYIDDDEAIVFLTTRILERLGYHVTGFIDPEQALERFRENPAGFDIVVTDLSMPNMSGLDLTQALHELRPDIQVLMTSGYVRPEDRERARERGVRDLILKPNSVEELGQALDRLFKELRGNAS